MDEPGRSSPAPMDIMKVAMSEVMKEYKEDNYELREVEDSQPFDKLRGKMLFYKVICAKSNKTHELMLKIPSKCDDMKKMLMMEKGFDREIFIFSVIIPELKNFCSRKYHGLLKYIPKYYWHGNQPTKEYLILRNYSALNYVWKYPDLLDFDHSLLSVRYLGKWHGVVMAYRTRKPEHFNVWMPKLSEIRYDILNKLGFVTHAKSVFTNVMKKLEEKGDHDLINKFQQFADKIEQYFKPASIENDRLVLTHGDCWSWNMMFRHKERQTRGIKFFNFLVSQLNTPIDDLSFFIYSSCDADTIDKFNMLLQEYYTAFSTTLTRLGYGSEVLYPYKIFKEHWIKYGMSGVLLSIGVHKLRLIRPGEIEQNSIDMENETDLLKILNMDISANDLYFERLLRVFDHYGNRYH